jgi:hypothetical protein
LGTAANVVERLGIFGGVSRDLQQRLVTKHAVAWDVARLRFAFAPRSQRRQQGQEFLVAGFSPSAARQACSGSSL